MGRSFDESDPLSFMTAPPPNETNEERIVREKEEAEARKVSEQIDEALNQEKTKLSKKRPVKVLLLGQSESGMCLPRSTSLRSCVMI